MLITQGSNFDAKSRQLAPDHALRSILPGAQKHVFHISSYAPLQVFL